MMRRSGITTPVDREQSIEVTVTETDDQDALIELLPTEDRFFDQLEQDGIHYVHGTGGTVLQSIKKYGLLSREKMIKLGVPIDLNVGEQEQGATTTGIQHGFCGIPSGVSIFSIFNYDKAIEYASIYRGTDKEGFQALLCFGDLKDMTLLKASTHPYVSEEIDLNHIVKIYVPNEKVNQVREIFMGTNIEILAFPESVLLPELTKITYRV